MSDERRRIPEPWRGRLTAGRGAGAAARIMLAGAHAATEYRGRREARLGRRREPLQRRAGGEKRGRGRTGLKPGWASNKEDSAGTPEKAAELVVKFLKGATLSVRSAQQ